ncbi:very long-chain specific acyl-CoA dehydrogenase, mitochondrial-like [Tetranychus urticae]|uniref:Very long-chain specific acyl-CoA dehydrogenase, mitochondrial n=1 Tax=Tetranychus urticae TaxID=32264 RepID=T1K9S8_TETUR|nr:very long-chain specific acyl-CoA dehydrogenase, mitochondrial-like [Tetranychus urticae]XP_015784566.1 very long-chain specific acyl-CoA dehydrogenase, mitochondrial-like [Tetranychus urticae]
MSTMMSVRFLRHFNVLKSTKLVYPHMRLMSAQAQPLEQVKEEKSNKREVKKEKLPETNSFIMSIFSGQANVNQVFPYPDVLTEDQVETLNMVREPTLKLFNEMHDPLVAELNGKADDKTIQMLKDMGSFGLMVPTKYEGAGLNNTQYATLAELSGQSDLGLAVTLGAHQSIGYKGILLFGNEKQKDKYLPDLATGRKTACFCLTEPSAGSDAGSLRCKAVLSPDGSHYILNGSKIWISNGGLADIFTVFARTPVITSSGEEKEKVTAFIVERAFGGVTSGPDEKKMGIKTSNTAHVYFENVKIPVENVLGEIGNGFKIAMNVLNSGRFGMGASMSGTMKLCIAKATDFANNRIQFGDKIASFGTIQEKIARMALAQYITESMTYMVAGNMDKGSTEFQLEAAISKVFGSEAAWFVCDETIQILGGSGYMRETGVEKIMRDLRIFRIFEGTNDILRLFVALTGIQNAGSHLKELQKAMKNPVANLGMIFDESTKRVFRAVGLSSGPSLTEFVSPELAPSAALVSKSVTNFGATVEHLLFKYNKKIIHEQFLLNRLANSAIDIYSMIVTLSRATRSVQKNFPSAQHEVNMVKVICNEASSRVHQNLVACRSSEKLNDLKNLKKISESLFVNNGVSHRHPIERD